MNKLMIIGNVSRDPDVRTTKTGKTVCSFSVAVNGRKKADGTTDTTFIRANAWEKTAELCAKYLSKGSKVYIDGPVSISTYAGKDGKERASLEVMVNGIEFLNRVEKTENENNTQETPAVVDVPYEQLPF